MKRLLMKRRSSGLFLSTHPNDTFRELQEPAIRICLLIAALSLVLLGCGSRATDPSQFADDIFVGGTVYTADEQRRVVSALAVQSGRIAYVGDDAGARKLIGEQTRVHAMKGAMILPGLHDMHIHALAIVPSDGCDIDSEPMTLEEIADFVAACIEEQALPQGEWLSVMQWSFSNGNQPDEALRNMRQALDRGAPNNPVMLWG